MITGSFAEYRMFYFHHGLDFATEGRIGVPILAMQSGKISKLQSLRYSIGNSATILQIDGYKSRYGHMDRFSDKILNSIPNDIKEKWHLREDFDRTLGKDEEISIDAGEVIGYSGSTGIGPAHLHVELFKDDFYYNPALYLPPHDIKGEIHITEVELYPLNSESFLEGKNQPLRIQIQKQGSVFQNKISKPLFLKGHFGIYLSGYESSGRTNRIGFQKISTFLNQKELQSIDFSKIKSNQMGRSCFIYDNYKSTMSGRPFRYILHNREKDSIEIFSQKDKFAGSIHTSNFMSDSTNSFEIILEGLNGKSSKVILNFLQDTTDYPILSNSKIFNITPKSKSTLNSEDKAIQLSFPEGSVFSDEFFYIEKTDIQISESGITQMTPVYGIRPDYREFNLGYDFLFNFPSSKEWNIEKIGLYGINEKGKILRYYPAAFFDSSKQNFKIHLKNTGLFTILQDDSKPTVKVIKYTNGHIFENKEFKLYLRARDSGSGVSEKGLQAWVDGEPVNLDFDPEAYLWEVFYPEKIKSSGTHILEAIATDRADNSSEKIKFVYIVN